MDMAVTVKVLTPAEVAEYLRISKTLVYRLIGSGEIPSFRVGGRSLRVRQDELERMWGQRA